MARKRTSIMIVDDNDMMRSILRAMLRGEEYEVVGEARNGAIAVDMADRLKPDIVCLDVMMPEKDGLEALAEIKAARPETAIVMITSNADPDTVQESIMGGASGFIVKPFNAARVLDTLEKVVGRLAQKNR
ncbi:response regulator [Quatrionicoccus australiensis]|uniref:response regulator n=1 Tax=Quatrionicoccus australiensis TaxID=138118 RepID=UPI001CFA2900|nr:response regulator [Quatrionicoccus australiensis]MCB4358607.1 response regulator [Quatrionicoccus australiensis]